MGVEPNLKPEVPEDSAEVAETGVLVGVLKLKDAVFGVVDIPNKNPVFEGVSSPAEMI